MTRAGRTMKAGHIHNTGTATPMQPGSPGDHVTARFLGLGEAEARLEN